ncbi:unnamed protein product [Hermetia illucens]|uniref:Icarapin-like n=1 Tax=Hermetia illucens TaxID=343691 RepID=A0A7R8UEU4_HERIL|nr:unnamed protein product [Hermetia illucens]
MKVLVGLFLAVAVCSTVGLPARDPNADAEYVTQSPPVDYFKDFSGVVDTGVDTRVNPFEGSEVGPDGFFNNISDFMRRFRERVFGGWFNSIPTLNIGELDPSKGNSTSVVKVIDGHRVEINDTVYTKTDEDGNAIYKVRVVNVRPLEEGETYSTSTEGGRTNPPEDSTQETKDREPLDNEVDGYSASESTTTSTQLHDSPTTTVKFSSEDEENLAETTTHSPSEFEEEKLESENIFDKSKKSDDSWEKKLEKLELKDANKPSPISSEESKPAEIDASFKPLSDNKVPKQRYVSPLHSEFSDEDEEETASSNLDEPTAERTEWDSFQDWHTNHETNSIDDFQSVPIDLSNDIEVNHMLADQGAPTNPDAEVFEVPQQSYYQPAPALEPIRQPYSWYPYQPNRFWPKRK